MMPKPYKKSAFKILDDLENLIHDSYHQDSYTRQGLAIIRNAYLYLSDPEWYVHELVNGRRGMTASFFSRITAQTIGDRCNRLIRTGQPWRCSLDAEHAGECISQENYKG